MKPVAGFTLLNALIAFLIFTFGMLSLASAYLKVNANLGDNEYFTSAGVLAESMHATLSASPALLSKMHNFSSAATQTDTALLDWVAQLKNTLPLGSATATAADKDGVACTSLLPCNAPSTVTLNITWQKKLRHSQTFVFQVGY